MHPTDHASPGPANARHPFLVVGFCAAWCNTCGDFRSAFEAQAARRPEARFVWLDIEDDADIVGDIDIENFPTIAIFVDERLLHFGVSLPHGPVVGRLLDSLEVASPTIAADEAITELPGRIGARAGTMTNADAS